MKKTLGIVALSLFSIVGVTLATENTDLIDKIDDLENNEQYQQAKQLDQNLEFESFSSCEDMSTVLTDFLKENEEYFKGRGGWGGPYYFEDDMVMAESAMDMSATDGAAAPRVANKAVGSSSTDISTTNLQVTGVDEPDILKTDGDYIYYYNQRQKEVTILKSPFDASSATIDLDDLEEVSTVKIPDSFNSVQLFLRKDKLVVLGQRRRNVAYNEYQLLDNGSRVDVVVFDITDPTDPTMERFTDLDGSYTDARMIDDELYVITQLSVNRWNARRLYDEQGDVIDVNDILPKTIDIAHQQTGEKPLVINGKTYPYGIDVEKTNCDDVLYVLPTTDSVKEGGLMPSFTVVRKIDVSSSSSDVQSTTAFGNTQTVHMSEDSLYLVNGLRVPYTFSCPVNARCLLPWFWGGEQHTLLHKFNVRSSGLKYDASTVVPGQPLTQYSMSEDDRGNFRILTKAWNPQVATNFFVLDDDLDLEGMIMNIEPGEEFKSSRYIGDKLYLVTFEQTDPLFVIDVADTDNPEIIGELKIPGFSTYLHPYADAKDGVQYLIGLGYDTELTQRGGVNTAGVKVDLYKIDYNKKSPSYEIVYKSVKELCGTIENEEELESLEDCLVDLAVEKCGHKNYESAECGDTIGIDMDYIEMNGLASCPEEEFECLKEYINEGKDAHTKVIPEGISVEQSFTETYGNKGSRSEALENPRMVVRDEKRELLVLPMILQDEEKGQNCSIQYNGNGEEIGRNCWDANTYKTIFAGMKGLTIDTVSGISESFSYDYLDLLKQDKQAYRSRNNEIYSWHFRQLMFRVGYLGDVLYSINNLFGHFTIMNTNSEEYVSFE